MYGDLEEAAMSKFIGRVIARWSMTNTSPGTSQAPSRRFIPIHREELNKRGFGMHAVPRRENLITGYKTDDVQKIFKNYMSGWRDS